MERVYSYSKLEPELKRNSNKSWLASCTSHTMHRFTVQLKKKITFLDDYFKQFSVFCFSLLLNSLTLESATKIFHHMVVVFCSEYNDSSVDDSLEILHSFIKERPEDDDEINEIIKKVYKDKDDQTVEAVEDDEDEEDFDLTQKLNDQSKPFIDDYDDSNKTIKDASPFTKHFNDVKDKILINKNTETTTPNPYLNVEYITFLLTFFIPYIFIWSSFTLRDTVFNEQITRITNGTIERHFRTKKKQIPRPEYPAQYVNSIVKSTLGQAVLKRKNETIYDPDTDISNEPIKRSKYPTQNMFDDKFRDRFKKPKKDIIKKKKYGWYQLKKKLEVPDSFKNILNDNNKIEIDIDIIDSLTNQTDSNNNIPDIISNDSFQKIQAESNDKILDIISLSQSTVNSPVKSTSQLIKSTKATKATKNIKYRCFSVDLFDKDLTCLSYASGKKSWLNDNVIYAYLKCCNYLNNTFFMESVQTKQILTNKSLVSKLNEDFTKYDFIAAPILINNNHWCCLFININPAEFLYLDPMGKNETTINSFFDNWKLWSSTVDSLKSKSWSLLDIDYTKQKDSTNCGIYICEYLKRLINFDLNLKFDNKAQALVNLRNIVKETINNNSFIV